MTQTPATPLLDKVHVPADLKAVDDRDLPQLASELRAEMIDAVSRTGGHLGAGLGVVELTIAIHKVFDTPKDRLIFDVGHQCYPHKILTGRRDRIRTLRQGGGLSGFTRRSESEYDPFGAAHSSTSISAGLGMAVARDLSGEERNVVCVIGDGAMSAGMAYEAMNNAGHLKSRLIVILNDNDMSIAPPVGAMSAYLARRMSGRTFSRMRKSWEWTAGHLPKRVSQFSRRAFEHTLGLMTGGTLFEELGFDYVGPIDGHNMDHLLPVLRNVKNNSDSRPVLVHVVTKKGHGYPPAEASDDKYHGVVKFDVATGQQSKSKGGAPSYTRVFAESLIREAQKDGIAEQHAVTFAAGMAAEGFKPFAAIYSTFLQRAYDQVVHDVVLQKLPVRFAIDRAGLVGADGATHAGAYDIAFLTCLPDIVVMAAADEAELMHMVATAAALDDIPSAFRFPRGEGVGVVLPAEGKPLEIGKGRVLREGSSLAILSFGTRLAECLKAADELAAHGITVTVADARFAKPLDRDLVLRLARSHELLMTVEEGSVGGFGSRVLEVIARTDLMERGLKVRTMALPDVFIDHDTPAAQYAMAGLDAGAIAAEALTALGRGAQARQLAGSRR